MIQCYYGNGKGKTTAAIGASIRCSGGGGRVVFAQFLKNNDSAEFKVIEKIENIKLLYSDEHYALYDNKKSELTPKFTKAYTKLLSETTAKEIKACDMLVLDEILDAVEFGYIDQIKLINLLENWKQEFEIILTGHKLPRSIAIICDYISEVREVRHPYSNGIISREGIEC